MSTLFTTYEAIGRREDLIDVITTVSPVDTWFTSTSGSTKAENTYHEWQTDALTAAAANKVVEGADSTPVAIVPTTRLGNYTQILRKEYRITDTQDAVVTAGRSTESGYQLQMKLKELARDIEYALIINATSAAGDSGTARQLKGVLGYISTNNETGSGTALEALTEAHLNNNLQTIWAAGGFPSNVLVGAFQKRTISAFSTNTRNIAASANEVSAAIDIYESDFGRLAVRLHHQLNTTAAGTMIILGDMAHWKKAWLRPVRQEELARAGASQKYMIEAELTLECRNELGHGKVTLLTVS